MGVCDSYLTLKLRFGRVLLEAVDISHEEEIFNNFTANVAKYMYPQPSEDISATSTFVVEARKRMMRKNEFQAVVLLAENREFLGCAGLHHMNELENLPQLGIWLKQDAWGQGYASEAITALRNFGKGVLGVKPWLEWPVAADNVASQKLARKMGGVQKGEPFMVSNANGDELEEVLFLIANK